ncbi:hypothetical protein [Budvicia aquatica]|uniref:Uncharacterized protein n=1 Tax=Budvicia aquatica TaxID=82979 RepID=A0A484ZD06_9GAMM|nr:hypothetical protein [Budvicia aquatica]VFS45461.1 Uncharacterised protein [Budvicia aquatica]
MSAIDIYPYPSSNYAFSWYTPRWMHSLPLPLLEFWSLVLKSVKLYFCRHFFIT